MIISALPVLVVPLLATRKGSRDGDGTSRVANEVPLQSTKESTSTHVAKLYLNQIAGHPVLSIRSSQLNAIASKMQNIPVSVWLCPSLLKKYNAVFWPGDISKEFFGFRRAQDSTL